MRINYENFLQMLPSPINVWDHSEEPPKFRQAIALFYGRSSAPLDSDDELRWLVVEEDGAATWRDNEEIRVCRKKHTDSGI
jgi:hypothetical protein